MKNKELFEKTVAILVKAYQNDTLKHGLCQMCAVGNIIAENMGFEPSVEGWINAGQDSTDWLSAANGGLVSQGFIQIKHTGYTPENISEIERSFETCNPGQNSDEKMFNGLMSVVDILMQIHEATTEEAESAKLLFVKA